MGRIGDVGIISANIPVPDVVQAAFERAHAQLGIQKRVIISEALALWLYKMGYLDEGEYHGI
mgnify:CR=1 FL=1